MKKVLIVGLLLFSIIFFQSLLKFVYSSYRRPSRFIGNIPPGCIETKGSGGCFNQYTIKDIAITPEFRCIDTEVASCAFEKASIRVFNNCKKSILINGYSIPPGADILLDTYDRMPTSNIYKKLEGKKDEQDFTFEYTVTSGCE